MLEKFNLGYFSFGKLEVIFNINKFSEKSENVIS